MVFDTTIEVRRTDDEPISETIVYAVAAARDVFPTELDTPLYSVIDTDALDNLMLSADQNGKFDTARIEFTWAGCDVVVHGSGHVVVTKPAVDIDDSRALAG